MIKRHCKMCNNEFYVRTLEIKRSRGIFCSRKCKALYQKNSLKGKNNPHWKGGKIERVCEVCGKKYSLIIALTKNNRGRFCSLKCFGVWRSKNIKGINNPNYVAKIKGKCKLCGKLIHNRKTVLDKGQGKFCSKNCYHTWTRCLRGEKSRMWKGGITPVVRLVRQGLKYQKWRKAVFLRDRYVCQKCGAVSKLEVHHKKMFSKIIERITHELPLLSLYGASMIYEPLWDISNGITLCKKCHKNIKHPWSFNGKTK